MEHPISDAELKQVPTFTTEEWQPTQIDENQAVMLQIVGNDGIERPDVIESMAAIGLDEEQAFALVDDLIAKRLVGWDEDKLVFLTQRCTTIFTPKDGIVVHDMNDERFEEWMMRPERWHNPSFFPAEDAP